MATAAAESSPEGVRMSFGEHLEELRWRLFKSVLALVICFGVAIVYYKPLLTFATRPHFKAMAMLGIARDKAQLITAAYTAPIWSVMKLAMIVSLIVASPVVAWQIWRFIGAGLYSTERKYVVRYAPVSFLLFIGGCAFGYFVLIPFGLYSMGQMMQVEEIAPLYNISDYLSLFLALTVFTGLIFELPLVMAFCTAIGLTTAKMWLKWIRFAIVAIFIAAAILTPSPDMFTQCLMAVPLTILYLIGIGLSALIGPKKRIDGGAAPS